MQLAEEAAALQQVHQFGYLRFTMDLFVYDVFHKTLVIDGNGLIQYFQFQLSWFRVQYGNRRSFSRIGFSFTLFTE